MSPMSFCYQKKAKMETEMRVLSDQDKKDSIHEFEGLLVNRNMSADDWVNHHASGTLRKNKKLKFSWRKQYIEERIAWEFGWPFKCLPRTRITFGDAITEGDCKPLTEAGWHMERYLSKYPYPGDTFEVKYIIVAPTQEEPGEEGVGLILRSTMVNWIPPGNLVYAIIAPFDTKKNEFLEARSL